MKIILFLFFGRHCEQKGLCVFCNMMIFCTLEKTFFCGLTFFIASKNVANCAEPLIYNDKKWAIFSLDSKHMGQRAKKNFIGCCTSCLFFPGGPSNASSVMCHSLTTGKDMLNKTQCSIILHDSFGDMWHNVKISLHTPQWCSEMHYFLFAAQLYIMAMWDDNAMANDRNEGVFRILYYLDWCF